MSENTKKATPIYLGGGRCEAIAYTATDVGRCPQSAIWQTDAGKFCNGHINEEARP